MMDFFDAARARRTDKVLADPSAPTAEPAFDRAAFEALIEAAQSAPFHYPAAAPHRSGAARSVAPFRFYGLDPAGCRALLRRLQAASAPAGKVLDMLAAASALALATWTPDPEGRLGGDGEPVAPDAYAPSLVNMEHIAAAGAAAQNFLLGATAQGWRTYWSSGGVLREPAGFEILGLPRAEILIGALFLFPQNVGSAEIKPGKLRAERGALSDGFRWLTPDE